MTAHNKTLTETITVNDAVYFERPYAYVTNSVRTSATTLLRLLRKPIRYVTFDLPPSYGYLEPGDTVWTYHELIPGAATGAEKFDTWRLIPLYVVEVYDPLVPARVTIKAVDLREVYCTYWSPFVTEVGMTDDLNGIAILDQAGGWSTSRAQLAYGERPGGDNVFQEVLADKPIVDMYGLLVEGGDDTNHLLNSALSEGSGNTFTSWTATTSGSAIAVEWTLYTLIDANGFRRACTFATYAAGEDAYLSQTVNTMDDKLLYVRVFYKNGGAYDDMTLRVQRSSDSKYWRDSDQTWQVGAVDNAISPKTGVVNSLRWISNLIDLTGVSTNLTISVGHFSCASAIAQISQLQGVELIEAPSSSDYYKYRAPLPTKGVAVTRVENVTHLVNDSAVRVLSPTRGFVKLTFVPNWNHDGLSDDETKYVWAADFDGATNVEWLRCYYKRVDSATGEWTFANAAGGAAVLEVTGTSLATYGEPYVLICRWTSDTVHEYAVQGQALDIWVNGTLGTQETAQATMVAAASCNVYLGCSVNVTEEKHADGHISYLTIGQHCPTEEELLRI